MHSEFEMSMIGELNFFLGLQIKQLKEGTFINQAKYIRDLLKRFNMEEAKTMKTPMSSSIKLDKDEKGKSIDSTLYRGMIGSLLYLTTSRLDIMYSVVDRFVRASDLNTSQLQHLSCVPRVSGVCASLSTSLVSFISDFLMASRRKTTASRAQGKCPTEPSQPTQTEHCGGLSEVQAEVCSKESSSRQKYQFLPTATFRPIFPTLVYAFYSRATYELGGSIISTVRGVEIQLDPESICRILDIALVGLSGMDKPSAHNLTVINRVLHYMICSILLPRGGHQDEVSYLEAFLMDYILTRRRIHVGYLLMMHIISCYESTTRLLPYGRFLTRVFKDVGIRKAERPPTQARGQGQATFPESIMSELTYKSPHTETLPHQTPHALDHAPWMDLSTQISSLGTRMEKLAVISDTRFYSMDDRMDQYQTGFTSQFEYL
ncbi:hypothetical protein AAG906_002362 [Vitis piasezkii]